MLKPTIRKLIIDQVPESVSVNGHSVTVNKTVGSVPLNPLSVPAVNIKFVAEGTPYYRSIDDQADIVNDVLKEQDVRSVVVRYTVGAKDEVVTSSETFVYSTLQTAYTLSNVPVNQIKSVGSYVNGTDYKLSPNRDSIIWLKQLTNNTTFTVTYEWLDSGFFVCSELINFLIKNTFGEFRHILAKNGVNVLRSTGIIDLSDIYANDALSACSCDIVLTYTYSWSRALTEEDGSLLDSIELDVYMNENLVDTIVVTKQ